MSEKVNDVDVESVSLAYPVTNIEYVPTSFDEELDILNNCEEFENEMNDGSIVPFCKVEL